MRLQEDFSVHSCTNNTLLPVVNNSRSRDSSACIATGYRLGRPAFESHQKQEFFFSSPQHPEDLFRQTSLLTDVFLILLIGIVGMEFSWFHSALRPPMAYCASPEWLWWWRNWWNDWQGNRSIRRKPAPVPLYPPQTPHASRTRTRAAAVGSQRLTAWATARPNQWLPGSIFSGIQLPDHEADNSPPSIAEVKNGGALPPLLHMSSYHSA
jgi:hypothetical protein